VPAMLVNCLPKLTFIALQRYTGFQQSLNLVGFKISFVGCGIKNCSTIFDFERTCPLFVPPLSPRVNTRLA
jgi:hypothetical protein